MKIVVKILILIFLIFLFTICTKPKKYPETPKIEFTSFIVKDTIDNPELQNHVKMGILKFSFVDGNGDIGLTQGDTLPPFDTSSVYYYNLYINMFEMKGGEFEHVNLSIPLNFRTPLVVPHGQNKTLKGWVLTELTYNFPLQYDTIMYTFHIYDRAHNQSNIASTDTIILSQE